MIILMNFTDTHCHIHEILGPAAGEATVATKWHKAGITDPQTVIDAAHADGVGAGVGGSVHLVS
jgi:hypothetical protein